LEIRFSHSKMSADSLRNWKQEGRSGDPHDHWIRAERELSGVAQDQSEATVEDVPPVVAARANQAVSA
jgi:hypothetical protein